MHISDKSPAGAQYTILLDIATEISSAVQFPTNKNHTNKNKKTPLKMKNDVGISCQKVCKQGRDESIKVKVSV